MDTTKCRLCGTTNNADGYNWGACDRCAQKALDAAERRQRANAYKRAKSAALRELCGTSARAAREDMGM